METNQKEYYSRICKSSDLVDIQKYINDVLELRGFNSQSAQDKMLLLTEEIGELAKAIRKSATSGISPTLNVPEQRDYRKEIILES